MLLAQLKPGDIVAPTGSMYRSTRLRRINGPTTYRDRHALSTPEGVKVTEADQGWDATLVERNGRKATRVAVNDRGSALVDWEDGSASFIFINGEENWTRNHWSVDYVLSTYPDENWRVVYTTVCPGAKKYV